MKLRLCVVGLDPAVLDPVSASAERQRSYFEGYQANILVLAPGPRLEVALSPSIRAVRPGGSGFLMYWRAFRLLRRWRFDEGKADVVTVQEPARCGMIAILSGISKHLHVQDHSAMFARPRLGLKGWVLDAVSRFVTRRAARIRTVSARGRRGLEAIDVDAKRIDVIPIATDISSFETIARVPSDRPRILTIARLYREKGIDVLLRAFATVHAARPDARLTIVGDGPERRTLERLASDAGISSSVHFAGSQSDIRPFLREADVYVQPSRFEGWGVAVVEAAAAGIPVVMTDVGCAGEVIVDGVSGSVAAPEDPKHLAGKIRHLLEHPDAANVMAAEAKKTVSGLPSVESTVAHVRSSLEDASREASPASPVFRLFLAAFGIRFALFLAVRIGVGESGFIFGDGLQYIGLAKSLLAGNGFLLDGVPFFFRTAGYPLILAAGLFVFRSVTAFAFIQTVVAACIPILVLRLGKDLRLGRRAVWIAAWVAALEPHLVFYSPMILTETVFTLLLLLAIRWTIRAMETKRIGDSVRAGIAFGLGMLVKPLFQAFPPVLFVFFLPWWKRIPWRTALKHAAVIVAIAVAFIIPWMARNQITFGKFAISSQGSTAALYYLGTSIVSIRDRIPYPDAEARIHQEFLTRYGDGLSKAEESAAFSTEAVRYIAENPGILARIIAINTFTLWTSSNYNSFLNYYHLTPPIDHSVLPPTHFLAQGRIGDFFGSFWKIFSQPFYVIGFFGRLVWLVITFFFLYGLLAAFIRIPEKRFPLVFLASICAYLTAVIWVDGLGIEARLRVPLMPIEFLYAAYGWVSWRLKRVPADRTARRLLVITQRVDEQDTNLGFHVAWLREFSARYESVDVITQSVGAFALPSNVRVHSMGKERRASRISQLFRFYGFALRSVSHCDAILVLMVAKYILLLVPLATLFQKKMYLWYAHGHVSRTLKAAVLFCAKVFSSSQKGFRLDTPKAEFLGQAIDTTFYSPDSGVRRDPNLFVTVGRISASKHLDVLIRMLRVLRDQGQVAHLHIVGDPILETDRDHEKTLREMVKIFELDSAVTFHGGQPPSVVRDWYRRAGFCLNASTTGSLDKAVLEAMACECPVVTCNEAFTDLLPSEARVASPDAEAFAHTVMTFDCTRYDAGQLRLLVVDRHERSVTLERMVHIMNS